MWRVGQGTEEQRMRGYQAPKHHPAWERAQLEFWKLPGLKSRAGFSRPPRPVCSRGHHGPALLPRKQSFLFSDITPSPWSLSTSLESSPVCFLFSEMEVWPKVQPEDPFHYTDGKIEEDSCLSAEHSTLKGLQVQ
jgi:hypothetical protein